MTDILQKRLEMMDNSPPITLDDVDFDFVNPAEQLALRVGDIFKYDAVIELRTGGPGGFAEMIKAIVPSARDPKSDYGQYLPRWLGHEVYHGEIEVEALRRLGLHAPTDLPEELPQVVSFLGKVTENFPWFEEVSTGVIATQGTRNEKMTLDHYRIEQQIMESLGETSFAKTAIHKIIHQEALHLSWNREKLKKIVSERSTLQLRAIAEIDRAIWRPVGAKSKLFRQDLQRATAQLAIGRESEVATMATNIQNVVDNILDTRLPKRRRQEFVLARILKVIEGFSTQTTNEQA